MSQTIGWNKYAEMSNLITLGHQVQMKRLGN
jgi:hypothetical protein